MTLEALGRELRSRIAGEVLIAEPMSRHTSFRIGGPADLFCVCDSLADLTETLRFLAEADVPVLVVGKGTNLLVADEGYRGAVVTLGREFMRHTVVGMRIQAGAACILAYVVRDAFSRGLAGLEFAVGIPGTFGGALAMNAGSRDVWMDSVVESVTVFSPGSGLRRVRGSEIAWGYRSSGFGEPAVIVEAVLALNEADPGVIRAQMEASLTRRKRSQPIGVPSAGSVFRNPRNDSAGRIIEAAGLKGTRLGGAAISTVHANFIVNEAGAATAADVVGLIRKVQLCVKDRYDIELEPEIRIVGRL